MVCLQLSLGLKRSFLDLRPCLVGQDPSVAHRQHALPAKPTALKHTQILYTSHGLNPSQNGSSSESIKSVHVMHLCERTLRPEPWDAEL